MTDRNRITPVDPIRPVRIPPDRAPRRDPRAEVDPPALKAAGLVIPPPPKLPSLGPSAPPGKPTSFSLKVSGLRDLGAFIGVLAGIGLGVWNRVDRAPEAKVDAHEERISAQRSRVEGPASEGGIAERVTELERQVWPMARQRCTEQQWLAQVLDHLGAQRVRVIGCPDPSPVTFVDGPMRNGRRVFIVDTPMPTE